eukprot:1378089-Prorocentrum_lima.AAC.1
MGSLSPLGGAKPEDRGPTGTQGSSSRPNSMVANSAWCGPLLPKWHEHCSTTTIRPAEASSPSLQAFPALSIGQEMGNLIPKLLFKSIKLSLIHI